MNYNVYTIYDKVTCQYSNLQLFANDDHAKREFVNMVKDSPIKDDLSLYKVGEFDTTSGDFAKDFAFINDFKGCVNE